MTSTHNRVIYSWYNSLVALLVQLVPPLLSLPFLPYDPTHNGACVNRQTTCTQRHIVNLLSNVSLGSRSSCRTFQSLRPAESLETFLSCWSLVTHVTWWPLECIYSYVEEREQERYVESTYCIYMCMQQCEIKGSISVTGLRDLISLIFLQWVLLFPYLLQRHPHHHVLACLAAPANTQEPIYIKCSVKWCVTISPFGPLSPGLPGIPSVPSIPLVPFTPCIKSTFTIPYA